jgi:hypothetical protein
MVYNNKNDDVISHIISTTAATILNPTIETIFRAVFDPKIS